MTGFRWSECAVPTAVPTAVPRVGLLLASLMLPAVLQAAPEVSLSVSVEKEVTELDDNNQSRTRRVEAVTTNPGEILYFTISYENSGDESALDINLDNPIPVGTVYQAESAWGNGADILFSVDGRSFAPASALQAGEGENTHTATPAEYRAIRWLIADLPNGSSGEAGFAVVVQ